MSITRSGATRTHQMHGFAFTALATPSLGSPQLAVWTVDAPARTASPEHSMSHDEVFVVQSGRLAATVAGERVDLAPGDALTVPAGAPFQLANPFDEPARALACTTAGMRATIGERSINPPWAA